MVGKKGPGEGKMERSVNRRKKENIEAWGLTRMTLGLLADPLLALCLSTAACQFKLFSLKHTEKNTERRFLQD